MKNIYILPTDKPTRLVEGLNDNLNIYIVSDENIKTNDIVLNTITKEIYKASDQDIIEFKENIGDEDEDFLTFNKKIILTTDQNLIKDNIQPIDVSFLHWLNINKTCVFIETTWETLYLNKCGWQPFPDEHFQVHEKKRIYKIITPKVEYKYDDYVKCGECNKFYLCTTCGAQCGTEGHFVENIEQETAYSKKIVLEFAEWLLIQDITCRGIGQYVNYIGDIVTTEHLFKQFIKSYELQ